MIAVLLLGGCLEREEPRSALEGPEFRFCEVPVQMDDHEAWCRFVAELPEDRCPGVHELCKGEFEPVERSAGCGERDPSRPELEEPYQTRPPVMFRWSSEATQELLRWTGAFLVAALILVLLRAFLATFGRGRRGGASSESDPRLETAPAPEEPPDDALPDVPALDAGGLIQRAEAAFSEGAWGEAAWLARGAALKQLHRRQRLKLHRSRTDREYLRALAAEPDLQADLRVVVDAAERHRWGATSVADALARRALDAARRLFELASVLLVAGGLVGAEPAWAQSDRFGPEGDAALAQVLSMHGFDAGYRLVSLERIGRDTDALFLDLSELAPNDEQWEGLRQWVSDGGILVIGGDAVLGFEGFGQRVTLESETPLVARSPLLGSDTPLPRFPDGPRFGFTEGRHWVTAEDVMGDRLGVVSQIVFGHGVVVGVSDPRLFDNLAFVEPDNEAFVGDLLYLGQAHLGWPLPTPARVRLVTRASMATDLPETNPVRSVANAQLLPFVLQLLATWTLLSLWRGWPFVPARPVAARDRLSFGEHVTALGTRWFRLGASGHALREVARLWLGRLGPAGLHQAARRAGYTQAQAQAFVARVTAAAGDAGSGAPSPGGEPRPDIGSPEAREDDLERMEEIWTITRQST